MSDRLTFFLVVNVQVRKLIHLNFTEQLTAALNLGYELLDEIYPGPWRRDHDNLYKGRVLINGRSQVVDRIRDQTGTLATLFLGDTRVATNVTLENGARALGTKAAPEVVETVLVNGENFIGEAEVVGRPFVTSYMPLRDSNGDIIGMWFVGVEKAQVNQIVRDLNLGLGLIIIASIACGILVTLLFTGYLLKPIPPMLTAFRRRPGDLSAVSASLKDEIGHLALGLNQMLAKQRELILLVQNTVDKVRNNYSKSPPVMKTLRRAPRRSRFFRRVIRNHGRSERLHPTGRRQRRTGTPVFRDNSKGGQRGRRSNREHRRGDGTDFNQ